MIGIETRDSVVLDRRNRRAMRRSEPTYARVNSPLNCSNTKEAIPVCAGTYEDSTIAKKQVFKESDVRFWRSNRSKIYAVTINDNTEEIHEKDWTQGLLEKEEDGYGTTQAFAPRAGCMYLLYIAIRIKED